MTCKCIKIRPYFKWEDVIVWETPAPVPTNCLSSRIYFLSLERYSLKKEGKQNQREEESKRGTQKEKVKKRTETEKVSNTADKSAVNAPQDVREFKSPVNFCGTECEERGGRESTIQKNKTDKAGDRRGQTIKDQKEGGGGAESLALVRRPTTFCSAHTCKLLPLFSNTSCLFLTGGRKRSMKTEWNGGFWSTKDPTSLLSTSLYQMTFTSSTTVSEFWMWRAKSSAH